MEPKIITDGIARIKLGLADHISLGNLDARRDWGDARDYVEAMWLMLQQDQPDDYVIATGVATSIREFLDIVFGLLDLDWQQYVEIDERYFRPSEVDVLLGDTTKAKIVLNWEPKVTFRELARMMTDADMKIARREKIIEEHENHGMEKNSISGIGQ